MFTNAELLPTLLKVLKDCPKLNIIVYDGEPKGDIVSQVETVREGVKLYTIQEVEALGRTKGEIKSVPPKRDDVRPPGLPPSACCAVSKLTGSASSRRPVADGLRHVHVGASTGPARRKAFGRPLTSTMRALLAGLDRHAQGCHSHARQPHLVGRRRLPPAVRDFQRAGRLPCLPVRAPFPSASHPHPPPLS